MSETDKTCPQWVSLSKEGDESTKIQTKHCSIPKALTGLSYPEHSPTPDGFFAFPVCRPVCSWHVHNLQETPNVNCVSLSSLKILGLCLIDSEENQNSPPFPLSFVSSGSATSNLISHPAPTFGGPGFFMQAYSSLWVSLRSQYDRANYLSLYRHAKWNVTLLMPQTSHADLPSTCCSFSSQGLFWLAFVSVRNPLYIELFAYYFCSLTCNSLKATEWSVLWEGLITKAENIFQFNNCSMRQLVTEFINEWWIALPLIIFWKHEMWRLACHF